MATTPYWQRQRRAAVVAALAAAQALPQRHEWITRADLITRLQRVLDHLPAEQAAMIRKLMEAETERLRQEQPRGRGSGHP